MNTSARLMKLSVISTPCASEPLTLGMSQALTHPSSGGSDGILVYRDDLEELTINEKVKLEIGLLASMEGDDREPPEETGVWFPANTPPEIEGQYLVLQQIDAVCLAWYTKPSTWLTHPEIPYRQKGRSVEGVTHWMNLLLPERNT